MAQRLIDAARESSRRNAVQLLLPNFISRALQNPLTYTWLGLLLALVSLYYYLTSAGRVTLESWFNSDFLFEVALAQDLADGFPFSSVNFSIAPSVFPDLFLTILLAQVCTHPATTAFLYGVFQFALLTVGFIVCGRVARMGDVQVLTSVVLLTAIGLTLGTILHLKLGLHLLFYLFLADCHMGTLVTTLLATALAMRLCFEPERTRVWRTMVGCYALVCVLGTVSDILFVSYFLAAFTVTAIFLMYVDLFLARHCVPALGVGWAASVVGWAAGKLLVNRAALDRQAPMTIDRMAEALKAFLHGAQTQIVGLDWIHLSAISWLLVCGVFVARMLRRHVAMQRRFGEMPEDARRQLFFLMFLMCSGVGSVVALVVGGTEGLLRDYIWAMHYQYPLYIGGLFGFGYLVSLAVTHLHQLRPVIDYYLRGAAVCAVFVTASMVIAAPKDAPGLDEFRPPLVRLLDESAPQYGLKYGIGGYWQTKWVNLFSRTGLRAYPVDSGLNPFFWKGNTQWFQGCRTSKFADPLYTYVILDDPAFKTSSDMVIKKFGPPAVELKCEQTRILVYNRPSDRRFQKLFEFNASALVALHPLKERGDRLDLPAVSLPSMVGAVEGDSRVAREGITLSGVLVFGPYVCLMPGDYVLGLKYRAEGTRQHAAGMWDAGCFSGSPTVLYGSGTIPNGDGELQVRIHLDAEQSRRPVELRALYSGRGNLTVKGISIVREK